MPEGIFLIQPDKTLTELTEQPYDSEALLQGLLADYPDLLAGKQIDPGAPRRWLLVTREASVPDELGGAGRWSVDHLFLDQEGIPTLVEVKRSSDTRIRREVVGQMLDYAANGVVYWPVESIRTQFQARCAREGRDPAATLGAFLGPDQDAGAFWSAVDKNLQIGRVRLLFVADEIPAELRRIVEFLNRQMVETEVLAVEIRQFVGQDLRTLVPRVIGRTEGAVAIKERRPGRQWDEASFFAALADREGAVAVAGARAVLEWGRRAGVDLWWGQGAQDGSFVLWLKDGDVKHWFVSCWTSGSMEALFQYMTSGPFADERLREALRQRLAQVEGYDIPPDTITRRPRLDLALLADERRQKALFAALDWELGEIRKWQAARPGRESPR
jgi:hypothetical protein